MGKAIDSLPPWIRIIPAGNALRESQQYMPVAKYRILEDGSMEFLGKVDGTRDGNLVIKERYFPEITEEFLQSFKQNLIAIFTGAHPEVEISDYDDEELWINLMGTRGWGAAFLDTCKTYEYEELGMYYDKLPWDASDQFDSDVIDLAIKMGVVKPMEIEVEVNESGVSSAEEQ